MPQKISDDCHDITEISPNIKTTTVALSAAVPSVMQLQKNPAMTVSLCFDSIDNYL
jgi:hypothetical protein